MSPDFDCDFPKFEIGLLQPHRVTGKFISSLGVRTLTKYYIKEFGSNVILKLPVKVSVVFGADQIYSKIYIFYKENNQTYNCLQAEVKKWL